MAEVRTAEYFFGILGLAAIRRWFEDDDLAAARVRDAAHLLAHIDEPPFATPIITREVEVDAGYALWAEHYDRALTRIYRDEEEVVLPLLADAVRRSGSEAPVGVDLGSGTGRHAAHLADLGCAVASVDRTRAMLEVAAARRRAGLVAGTFEALPLASASAEVAVCAMSLCHTDDLPAAFAEMGRVCRPGATLVVSDPHPMSEFRGSQAFVPTMSDAVFIRSHRHQVSDYVTAAHRNGFRLVECAEPIIPDEVLGYHPAAKTFPDAVLGAFSGLPWLLVLAFERA